jgi:hypothetical protein
LDKLVFQRRDPEWTRSPIAFRDVHATHWLRMVTAALPREKPFRGSVTRPTQLPPYASLRGSPHAAQGLGFPGVDSSRDRTCLISSCRSISLTCFLVPAFTDASVLAVRPFWMRTKARRPRVPRTDR